MDRPTRQELHELLSALLDGTLPPERQDRLRDLLRQHPQARDLYLAYFTLHASLSLRGGAGDLSLRSLSESGEATVNRSDRQTGRPTVRFPSAWSPPLLVSVVGLAAGLLLVLAYWLWSPAALTDQPDEPTHQTVAVLLQAPGAVWEDTGLPTEVGAPLPAGRLRLQSGFAQIEFYSGATVILEGPADFELISSREAFCSRGRLRATVPSQAQGFTIRSPKLDLVDRGTEFGLQVGENDRTEVHVFQGKVELYDPGSDRETSAPREVTTGQGVRLDAAGPFRAIELNAAAFLTARDLAARLDAEIQRRQQEWLTANQAMQRDPDLLVYYTFEAEQPWSRTLRDQTDGRRPPHDGAIIGCSRVAGRWPGKLGLEFKRFSDRVRFHVPGEFESVSLLAWVRVDALSNRHNSLMMTDGWDEGELHWHMGASGSVRLGIQGRSLKNGTNYVTAPVFTPDRLGQWVHLAVVYDRDRRRVTHYVDGQPLRREATRSEPPLRIGDAELGNWNVASRQDNQPIRNFSGCKDEFMLFSRALTDENVLDLYAQGKRWALPPARGD